MKKAIVILLALLLIIPPFSLSVAEENQFENWNGLMEERFIALSQASASLSISNNTAKCKAFAYANSSEYHLYVTLSLQKMNGNTWSTIASWIGSGSGITGVVLNKSRSGLSSGTYRCKAYVRVYDSHGAFVESTTVYSQTCTI